MDDTLRLSLIALAGMALLLVLVIRFKLHAMVTLVLVSLLIGLAAGMSGEQVVASMTKGMGGTLGAIALLVGLGAMFGQMLEVSGGAERVAQTLVDRLGLSKAPWAMGLAGFIVSIPIFFDVAFIILVPIVYGLSRRTGSPVLYYGVPLLAGLAVTHAFVPPTPGPIAVAGLLKADLGLVILFGIAAGLPAMAIAGPLYGRWIARRIPGRVSGYAEVQPLGPAAPLPSFGVVATLIVIPLLLILTKTTVDAFARGMDGDTLARTASWRGVVGLLGEPVVALLITTLLCFRILGTQRGYTREQVQEIATKSLEPAGIILLVTGAGGVLKQVLIDSNVGKVLADALSEQSVPIVFMGFTLAAVVRVMQGSATVAMMTGGGLMASMIEETPLSPPKLALLVIAIAAGATTTSHVNDSGFWLVSRYLGLSVPETLKSWTVVTTIIALVGLAVAAGLWVIVG